MEITAQKIRKVIKKKKSKIQHSCYICEDHIFITEEHHIIPIKKIVKRMDTIMRYELNGDELIPNETVFLCPNCHAYFHKFLNSKVRFKIFIGHYEKISKEYVLNFWLKTFAMKRKYVGLMKIIREYESRRYE